MIQINQDEYMRMLDPLNYQANFILKNTDVDKLNKELNDVLDFLDMCNDLDIVFEKYISAKDKYNLSDEYLAELNKTKKQLNDFVFDKFPVEELVGGRMSSRQGC